MKFRRQLAVFTVVILADLCLAAGLFLLVKSGCVWQKAGRWETASARELDGKPKTVALTFDDGPHPVYTKKLLEGLSERGVRASFFLIGKSIDGNEALVARMKEDGHLIGNHSQEHAQLTKEDVGTACEQINSTSQKIFEITGEMPSCIRPPFGSWSDELDRCVPMQVVLWDIDTLDWKTKDKEKIVQHVLKNVEDGSIILVHDVYETSVEAALEIVDLLQQRGYLFVTADELMID